MPSEVQSVLFDKSKFNQKTAETWLKKNDFKKTFHGKKVDITKNKLRYRQQAPSKFNKYRIKKLNQGVEFVMGFK